MPERVEHEITCKIKLPENFCIESILDFHKRDPMQLAEQVDSQHKTIRNGVLLNGERVCLYFKFPDTAVTVICKTKVSKQYMTTQNLAKWAQHILGLSQPVEKFEQTYAAHSELGPLIQKQCGLRIPLIATRFEALTWSIISQQISLKVAIALRRKWIKIAGKPYDDTLWCYPEAQGSAKVSFEQLQSIGLTQAKIRTLLHVSHAIQANTLFDEQTHYSQEALSKIYTSLLKCVGIGPWTAHFTLLTGFGYLGGALHQDAGVRHGLQRLLSLHQKPSVQKTKDWLSQFPPWRSLVAAHLWKFLETRQARNK